MASMVKSESDIVHNNHNAADTSEEKQRLTLAFKNLDHMPPSLTSDEFSLVQILDLSHNNFSDLSFLKNFTSLTSLILDHNQVGSSSTFPTIASLRLLWLNHNKITRLFPFVQRLRTAFPCLEHLSLMANEAVPINFDDSTFYQHLQYRLFVISWFNDLQHLDDQLVSESEKSEAYRLYRRPLLERILHKYPVRKLFSTVTGSGSNSNKRESQRLRPSFV